MATAENMYNNWCLEELRGASQVNKDVWLAWFNKGLLIFEKMILEYVSAKQNTSSLVQNITKWESVYELPLDEWIRPDFYSIILFSLCCIKLVGIYIPATGNGFCSANMFLVIDYNSKRKLIECGNKHLLFGVTKFWG